MDGQRQQDSGGANRSRAKPKRGRRKVQLPDKLGIACPAGTRDRIEAAAESDGFAPADWMRHAIRSALDASRKRADRRGES